MGRMRKIGTTLALAAMMVLAAVPAFAQETELETAISSAATQVQSQITSILPTVLGVAAFLLVINVGWRFFRRFVR